MKLTSWRRSCCCEKKITLVGFNRLKLNWQSQRNLRFFGSRRRRSSCWHENSWISSKRVLEFESSIFYKFFFPIELQLNIVSNVTKSQRAVASSTLASTANLSNEVS